MIFPDELVKFISSGLSSQVPHLFFVGIFGSIAANRIDPNDCDLLVISRESPPSHKWQRLREALRKLSEQFYERWNIPLSITLLTKNEVREGGNFILSVISRPIVSILGTQNKVIELINTNKEYI